MVAKQWYEKQIEPAAPPLVVLCPPAELVIDRFERLCTLLQMPPVSLMYEKPIEPAAPPLVVLYPPKEFEICRFARTCSLLLLV